LRMGRPNTTLAARGRKTKNLPDLKLRTMKTRRAKRN